MNQMEVVPSDLEPAVKKMKPDQEPDESEVKLNDLPELPFEKILSYLTLGDLIKCRAISRKWRKTIDSFRPKSLCYSQEPSDFIYEKGRWVSGSFARNIVNSFNIVSFFQTFASSSILSKLKHLRLYKPRLAPESALAFAQALNSFGRLEELDMVGFDYLLAGSSPNLKLSLNLPMLRSIQLEGAAGIHTLTLDAPRLQNVKKYCGILNLKLVHIESVEKLIIKNSPGLGVKDMKNLKYLFFTGPSINSTFLSGLEQLKEIHLFEPNDVKVCRDLFQQKQQYGRVDLKIFLAGCLLSGPNDPSIIAVQSERRLAHLAEQDSSRLADQIPFIFYLNYNVIQCVPPESQIAILSRFTDLRKIFVSHPVQNIERFLDILKNSDNIVELEFECDQPQQLFDRLPDCCAIQKLAIYGKLADFRFLLRFRHLLKFYFRTLILEAQHHPKQCMALFGMRKVYFSDLHSAIRSVFERPTSKQ